MANENARRLRKRLTPQEVKLWVKLRSLKTMGLHIRRQAPVGRYIVDFICFSRKSSLKLTAVNTTSLNTPSKIAFATTF